MTMNLESLSLFFEERLKKEMPGESAHSLMQPKLKSGSNIRFNHLTQPKKGGVLILLYEEDGVVKFPLIERQDYDGIHSGQISLPGGKKEKTDGDLVQTALRETEEEIGISRSEIRVLGNLTQFFVGASNHDILPVIGMLSSAPKFVPEPREVREILTPPIADLLDIEKRRMKDINVRNGYMLSSPYFDLESKMVWGATAMMLSEFVSVLNEFKP